MSTTTQQTTDKAQLARDYNAGLERGRRHQERGGHTPWCGVYDWPMDRQSAYMAGWQKGFDTTTDIARLRRAV